MLGSIATLLLFTFPETLFSRSEFSNLEQRPYLQRMFLHGKVLNRKLKLSDWSNNFKMMKYWSIIIPCAYYAT